MAIAIGLLKMLLELQQTRKTGALDVAGPSARVRLFVEDGHVVFADEGTIGETLGRILVRERVLTQEQYGAAIEWMSDLRAAGKTARLGEVFVDLGLLTREQVIAALAAQVQQKVMRALAWSSATFRFLESHGPLELSDRFVTVIEPLVIAALRLADRERIDALLSQAGPRYAALRGDRLPGGGSTKLESIARVNAFRLPAAEDAFARTLDGSRTVTELLAETDDPDAGRVERGVVLAALLLTDALDLHRGPTAVRPMGRPKPVRAVGVKPSASAALAAIANEGAKARADAKAKADAEAKAEARARADAKAQAKADAEAEAIAKADAAALDAPPDSERRMPDGEKMAPLLAEKAYQAGKKLVRGHRLADAVVELKRAASLYKAVEYDLWAAWAEARADARGEERHTDALRAVAELAIEQDTERGFATFVLGHLAKRRGDDAQATELFARARALDPEVATIDAWDVRLRIGEPSPESTRGDVKALAPLLTGEKEEGNASANANANASADADANANANANANASANADASEEADAAREVAADARLGTELRTRAEREAAGRTRREQRRARAVAVEAVEAVEAPPHARASRGWLVPAVVLGLIVGGVWLVMRTTPHDAAPIVNGSTTSTATTAIATSATTATSATAAAIAASSVEPPVSAPARASSEAASVASAVPVASAATTAAGTVTSDASYAEVDAGLPSVDASKGVLVLPSAADGHRVYVDGHLAGVPPPPIVLTCGRHTIKIGSQGREQVAYVPCGGSLPLAYP